MKQFKNTLFILLISLASFGSITHAAIGSPERPADDEVNVTNSGNTAPKKEPVLVQTQTRYDDNGTPITSGTTNNTFDMMGGAVKQVTDFAIAQTELDKAIEQVEPQEGNQAVVYDTKDQSAQNEALKQQAVQSVATDVVGCSAGQILGSIISSAVSSAMTSALGYVVEKASGLINVPTQESGQVLLNSKTQSSAEVGTTVGAFGIGILALPSWNSIAYCVVNAMIEYVANSTIAWIQGGFEGNPSFVNNPEQFFKDLADVEASAFLKELAYGTLGLNICEPFRVQIVLTIARSHIGNQQAYGGQGGYSRGGFGGGGGANGYEYGGCTLDDIKGNLEGFLEGNFDNGGWDSWFQVSQIDSNNPYSTYLNLQAQLNGAISKKQNLASVELDWGKGFLSFRKCDEKTPKEKQKDCPITSPGVIIQGQLEKTLGLAKDRLVLAEKFDQVIAAVVNQLINTALDKVLEVVVE